MKLHSDSFPHRGVIPAEFAFAVINDKTRVKLSANKNPQFSWSDAPQGTQSCNPTPSSAISNLVISAMATLLDWQDLNSRSQIFGPLNLP